ncbi:MAG: DUF5693 family protein [Armatimonadota bacterium]
MTRHQRDFIIVLIIIGLGAAAWIAYQRVQVESAGRDVALCVDYTEVERLAGLTGVEIEEILKDLHQAGATHCAINEMTLNEMILSGNFSIFQEPGQVIRSQCSSDRPIETLQAKLPGITIQPEPYGGGQYQGRRMPVTTRAVGHFKQGNVSVFGSVGVAYDPFARGKIAEAGLEPVARPVPDLCNTPQAVARSIEDAKWNGTGLVIFQGDRVVGAPGLIPETARRLQEHDLQFGMVELAPQTGEYALARELDYQVLRCHSIPTEEMATMSTDRAIHRYLLAVTERKVRLCYVRLVLTPAADLLAANRDYLSDLSGALAEAGYTTGSPQPFSPIDWSPMLLKLLALGLLGGFLWLLQVTLGLSPRAFWLTGAVAFLAAMGAATPSLSLGRPLIALAAGLVFPIVAVTSVREAYPDIEDRRRGTKPLLAGWLLVRAALITAIGGFIAAAALSEDPYLMRVAQFRGVKLAQAVPLVVIGVVFAARATCEYRQSVKIAPLWKALGSGLGAIGRASVRYWHAGLMLVILGMVGYMLMRSGNQPAIGIADLEIKLRSTLDALLGVRPRTKEIFLGYPALYVGLMLLLHGRFRVYWLFMGLGAISQISLFNTFCHLHTPLTISLLRVAHGIWIGLLIGLVWWAVKRAADAACQRFFTEESDPTQ